MSRLDWMGHRRPRQLLAAATDGRLYYDAAGILRHAAGDTPAASDLAAHRLDAEIVADFITAGLLRRDDSGTVTKAGAS